MVETKPKKIKEFSIVTTDETGKETEKSYLLVQPTNKTIRDSRWKYSIVFNQAIKDGLLTERQMSKILTKDKADVQEDSDRLTKLYIKAGVAEQQLSEEEDLTVKQEIAENLRSLRAEIFEEEATIRAPYYNTAEQRAEEARADFLLMYMICNKDKDSTAVWDTNEVYELESDMELLDTSRMYLMYWMHNLDYDWEQQLPENKVFDEVMQGLQEDAKGVPDITEVELPEENKKLTTTSKTSTKRKKKTPTKKRQTKTRTQKSKKVASRETLVSSEA